MKIRIDIGRSFSDLGLRLSLFAASDDNLGGSLPYCSIQRRCRNERDSEAARNVFLHLALHCIGHAITGLFRQNFINGVRRRTDPIPNGYLWLDRPHRQKSMRIDDFIV
jgi:hypothetical protein